MSEEPLPEWAINAMMDGEAVTVRGEHIPAGERIEWEAPEDERTESGPPFEDFEEAVEHFKDDMEVDDPEAMAGAMMTGGRIEVDNNLDATQPHPNCRSSHIRADEVNVTVDGDIDDVEGAVRKAVDRLAEEAHERSKNLLKR